MEDQICSVHPIRIPNLVSQNKPNIILLHIKSNPQVNEFSFNSHHISNLSHDLCTPLFNIGSFLETLYEYNDQLKASQRLELLEIATNETNRLKVLVKDILEFAEMESQNSLSRSKVELSNSINQVINLNKLTLINKRLTVLNSIEKTSNLIICNETDLNRILSNLLNNSIKFTYPKNILSIQVKKSNYLLLERNHTEFFTRIFTIDRGIGISKSNKENLFSRFSRGSVKTKFVRGSGLGLSIVKELLSKQKKGLNFSTNPRKGSSVSFNIDFVFKLEKGLEPATY